MSPQPQQPVSSEAAADLPKDLDNPRESLPPPTSQGENCDNPTAAPAPSSSRDSHSPSPTSSTSSQESGEASPEPPTDPTTETPLNEPASTAEDDGWDFHWDATSQAYFFHNRFTNQSTWENPRVSKEATSDTGPAPGTAADPPKNERPAAGGYNPAIHGDYDPTAWYAQNSEEQAVEQEQQQQAAVDASAAYAALGSFNRFTGQWQNGGEPGSGNDVNTPGRHTDEAKSRRQMNAFFDVDAAANSHDGRSLKAERSGKKPTKAELKQFKEKRRARKEEKRRAWLRD
ncbi:hypothetical protein GGS23DRAFT_591800 [Durotheca rogersii]|uniref:uncharacterized protein n=1 Tax=Durotheca rogersii TaxID=419775 RepID=UPI0022205433|nr:uncharacterized protein GGS23DRAFT_591800 [Durotheca rogersii]KAI5867995.1 hypothetical protein GGS23DRAFT_591800 [Durotheca rogersii]